MKTSIKSGDSTKYRIFKQSIKDVPAFNKLHKQISITNLFLISAILFCVWQFGACAGMAPVNSSFESAKTLGKGNAELMGDYSHYLARYSDDNGSHESMSTNNNYGFRVGYGISERVDMKFRYERMVPVQEEDKEYLKGANYFAFSTRCAFKKDYITGAFDFGLYTYKEKESDYSDQIFFLSPKIAFTYPSTKYFDLTLTPKIDWYPVESTTYWGLNLGCGISSDFNKWAFRPEIGWMKNFEDSSIGYWTGGVALIVKINSKK